MPSLAITTLRSSPRQPRPSPSSSFTSKLTVIPTNRNKYGDGGAAASTQNASPSTKVTSQRSAQSSMPRQLPATITIHDDSDSDGSDSDDELPRTSYTRRGLVNKYRSATIRLTRALEAPIHGTTIKYRTDLCDFFNAVEDYDSEVTLTDAERTPKKLRLPGTSLVIDSGKATAVLRHSRQSGIPHFMPTREAEPNIARKTREELLATGRALGVTEKWLSPVLGQKALERYPKGERSEIQKLHDHRDRVLDRRSRVGKIFMCISTVMEIAPKESFDIESPNPNFIATPKMSPMHAASSAAQSSITAQSGSARREVAIIRDNDFASPLASSPMTTRLQRMIISNGDDDNDSDEKNDAAQHPAEHSIAEPLRSEICSSSPASHSQNPTTVHGNTTNELAVATSRAKEHVDTSDAVSNHKRLAATLATTRPTKTISIPIRCYYKRPRDEDAEMPEAKKVRVESDEEELDAVVVKKEDLGYADRMDLAAKSAAADLLGLKTEEARVINFNPMRDGEGLVTVKKEEHGQQRVGDHVAHNNKQSKKTIKNKNKKANQYKKKSRRNSRKQNRLLIRRVWVGRGATRSPLMGEDTCLLDLLGS